MATYVSRKEAIQEGYKTAEFREKKGSDLLNDIAWTIQNMTDSKISAVRRIMDTAENTAQAHMAKNDEVTEFVSYNAKNLPQGSDKLILTSNKHFYNYEVNTNFSVVHVPTNVFDKSTEILKAVKWSETLTSIFKSNYQMDPSLSWQYFGSSLGFFRQYPAIEWKPSPRDVDVDLYDCRTRSWFIEAATSPKDLVILVDNSGSMTGLRREIARHVVSDILDTLGPNDFVNVFNFSANISDVVPCFEKTLVQANPGNIRALKRGMRDLFTDKQADFSAALIMAFELLKMSRENNVGACCNQAIMLITDGVPYNYKDIFQEYNWRDLPYMPVRVFTYLIGREITDIREVKWIACANHGYFVQLSTLAEVKEKVLDYIPVMARPLALWKNKHPIIWTPLYADVTDPKMTDWIWGNKQSEVQKKIFQDYRMDRLRNFTTMEQFQNYVVEKLNDEPDDLQKYQFMTSVSMPVLDRRENNTKVANLLGVAGTDIPIKDIQELLLPHKLGVNGYAFIVTNNGYVLIHPDLRPVYQRILKPSFSSVDVTEVELEKDNDEPRMAREELQKLREEVVNQSTGSMDIDVKYHYDNMKRASTMKREYHYCAIENTPFTLVISLPKKYGFYKIHGQVDIHLSRREGKDVTKLFHDTNWKVHPDWIYCRYHNDTDHPFDSPEQEFIYFLKRANKQQKQKWLWLSKRTVTPPEGQSHSSPGESGKLEKNSYFCDRDLFLSLIFDAQATESFSKNTSGGSTKELKGKEFQEKFGVIVSFVATHNGLTRWKDYVGVDEQKGEKHFSEVNNKAIDEIWYKRAVEYHYKDPDAYVYSVPIDAGDNNGTLVTASHAIFVHGPHPNQKEVKKSPAAVIGFQFPHSTLYSMLNNLKYSKDDRSTPNKKDLDYYVLDNSGYIVVSESQKETGQFFGEVEAFVMEKMIQRGIFSPILIFDYQAVCFFATKSASNIATFSRTPLDHLKWLVKWTLGSVLWMMMKVNVHVMWLSHVVHASEEENGSSENEEEGLDAMPVESKGSEKQYEKLKINRTRPLMCDKEVTLYEMDLFSIKEYQTSKDPRTCDNRTFEVEVIPSSNLLLVVVNKLCPMQDEIVMLTVNPIEVNYNFTSLACYKFGNKLSRRRPPICIHRHPEEKKIELCGGCSTLQLSFSLFLHCWFVMTLLAHRER